MRVKADARPIDGVLLLDKPEGITSNRALQQVKRLYQARKAGHVGTLDPLATGLLPICLGEATKFAGTLLDSDKAYQTTIKLGERTDTADAEGRIIEKREVSVTQAALQAVLAGFRGQIEQIPPMYSAVKQAGVPLYELARQGKVLDRKPRGVRIDQLTLLSFALPLVELEVRCSKGTYIRVLADDIGLALGCGAHVTALRRTAVGDFTIAEAVPMALLENLSIGERDGLLRPADALLGAWPRVELTDLLSQNFLKGMGVLASGQGWVDSTQVAVYSQSGRFLGLGEASGGLLKPRRLLRNV